MSWERKDWIERYQAGERISEIAADHEVSRKTVYKWVERYAEFGEQGLEELSRAPHSHPSAVEPVWRERVAAVRQRHRGWGAGKIAWLLKQQHGEPTPSPSTIGRLLRESGLTRSRRRAPKVQGTGALADADQPNQLWSIDFKGWCRTGDGRRCEPLTLADQATRYLLCCQHLDSTRSERVRAVMERVFCEYGMPERMRSDNGAPFASTGACGLTELSVWWIELGLIWERIAPGRPQQNGRHERMHRSLREWAMNPPAATMRQQQRRLEQFREYFNQQRPHEGLGQRVPAELYRRAMREYPRRIVAPEYGSNWGVRVVDGGRVSWNSERVFVSHALNGKQVGFEPFEEGRWRVWFYRQWLGVWDQRRDRLFRPQEWERWLKAHQQD